MNDASGGPRSGTATQEYRVMAATKVLAQPDSKKNKQIGELAAGTVVLAMDTRMDRRGHSFIYHRGAGVPGWSPTHSDDNMPVLVPVDANASQARTSMTGGTRVQASGRASSATITPGSHMVVKVKAPFFRLHEHDNQVQGLLEKGDVIEVIETKNDHAGRTKVRHSRGWTPVLAPDNSVALELAKRPSQSDPSIEKNSTTKPPPQSQSSPETAPRATTAVENAEGEPQGPPPAEPQPEPQSHVPHGRVRPQRSQSMRLDSLAEEAQDQPVKYVPRGRRGSISGRLSGQQKQAQQSGSKQAWQKVRSSVGDGRLQSVADGRKSVRLLYVSGEHGFGMEYGVNEQTLPIVKNYLGDSARRAGVDLGSVIASVDKLPVTSIQQLAQVLQQKEHIARQFADAAVEFELVPPAAARSDDLLALVGGASPPVNGILGDIVEAQADVFSSPRDSQESELKQLSQQISAVGKVAEQLLRDLPGLRAKLAAATTEDAKSELIEEIHDNESALKQQQVTQGQLFSKQLKLIATNCEKLSKQRDFQIEEAKKFVTFQTKHIVEQESTIKGKQEEIYTATAKMEELSKAQDQKQATLMAEHSESTAPLKAQMEERLKEVAALDEEIAELIATLKAKQKVRDETMDKADELKGSINAQLKLFAAPALEQIELEKQRLAQTKAQLQKQNDTVAAEVNAAREGRIAASQTRAQREAQIAATTDELLRLQQLGGRSAMLLERLRTDADARVQIVSAKSSTPKAALADAEHKLEILEQSEEGKAARSLQSLDERIPQLETEISGLKSRLTKLGADKIAFAKAKQFKEAGQAKKDIDAAEERLTQLEAQLAKERATASSGSAQDAANAYATKLSAARQAAAAAKLAYGAALVAGETEWLGILKGRRNAAEKLDDQSSASYIAVQMTVVENDARSIAKLYSFDPATIDSAAIEAVPEDTSVAKAQQATYPIVTPLTLESFPLSRIGIVAPSEDSGNGCNGKGPDGGAKQADERKLDANGNAGPADSAQQDDIGSSASDTDSDGS